MIDPAKRVTTALRRSLYRNRRRFLIIALFSFAIGALKSAEVGQTPLLFGLATVIVFGGIGVLIATLLPWVRAMTEIVLAGLLLADLTKPIYQDWGWINDGNAALVITIAILILTQLYCSRVLDGIFRLSSLTCRLRARTRLPAGTVFNAIVGVAGQPQHLLDADRTEFFDHPDGDTSRIHLVERQPCGGRIEELYHVQEENWPLLRAFTWEVLHSDVTVPFRAGRDRLELTETRSGTIISRSTTVMNYPLRAAIWQWVDDGHGRLLDQRLTQLEKRARQSVGSDYSPVFT